MSHFRTVLPILGPNLAFSLGEGALIPIIPAVAASIGADLATAGLIAAMIPVGRLVADMPTGVLVARIGEKTSMIGAAVVSMLGVGLAVSAASALQLGIGVLLVGLSAAVFTIARHAFMTVAVPYEIRARALALLGGTDRLGQFTGPFFAAALIQITADTQSVFFVHLVACLIAAALLFTLPDPQTLWARRNNLGTAAPPASRVVQNPQLFKTIWRRRDVLTRLGVGAALVSALRTSRTVIIPLWAVSIGVPDATTALIIGLAGALDFSLFYASGQIMDRWGRIWTGVPALVGPGTAHLVLSFTHDLDARFGWFVGAAILMALANGIGSGILMTLGADLADRESPAPFLAVWRFTSDVGGASAPLIVSGLTAWLSISVAAGTMGVAGFVGAAILARYIPRYAPHKGVGKPGDEQPQVK